MGILNRLFGPSRQELWTQFAGEIGGDYMEGPLKLAEGFYSDHKGGKVIMEGHKTVTLLDIYNKDKKRGKTKYVTRIRRYFPALSDLEMYVYPSGFFPNIGKMFGMQDIKINDDDFDKAFIVKGNDEYKVTWILDSPSVKRKMLAASHVNYMVKPVDNMNFLSWTKRGQEKNIEMFHEVIELFDLLQVKIEEINK